MIKLNKKYKIETYNFANKIVNVLNSGSISKKIEIIILYDLTNIIAKNAYTIFGSTIINEVAIQLKLTNKGIKNILNGNKSANIFEGSLLNNFLLRYLRDILIDNIVKNIIIIILAYFNIPYHNIIIMIIIKIFLIINKKILLYNFILTEALQNSISEHIISYYKKLDPIIIEYTKVYILPEENLSNNANIFQSYLSSEQ